MNRKNLISLVVLDILVMLLAAGLFVHRYRSLNRTPDDISAGREAAAPALSLAAAEPVTEQDTSDDPLPPLGDALAEGAPAPETRAREQAKEKRNIGFNFRHSRAKKVDIVGDFNGWMPQPMIRGTDHRWNIILSIEPGEYAYNLLVDGKIIRDPNNQKVCDAGKGFPSSLLRVKSIAEERNKSE